MAAQISHADLDAVKVAITNAERGKGSLVALARAYEICQGAGALRTLAVVGEHIHRMTPNPQLNLLPSVFSGVVSGTLVTLMVGRLAIGRIA